MDYSSTNMPGTIQFMNRKWPLASDDLVLPATVGLYFRVLMVAGSVAILGVCAARGGMPLQLAFLAVSLFVSFLSLVAYALLFSASRSGTMMEYEPRTRLVERRLRQLGLVYAMEVVALALGAACLATAKPFVPRDIRNICVLIGVVAWVVDLVSIVCAFIFVQYLTGVSVLRERSQLELRTLYESRLRRGFSMLAFVTCSFFGTVASPGGVGDYAWQQTSEVVYTAMHDFMEGLTLSDALAALILLRIQQKEEKSRALQEMVARVTSKNPAALPVAESVKAGIFPSSVPIFSVTKDAWTEMTGDVISADERADCIRIIRKGHKYAPYAVGMYGYMLQLYSSPLFFCRVHLGLLYRQYCGCLGAKRSVDDSHIDAQVFQHTVPEAQVLYSSFTSYMAEAVPYTVSVDHTRKAVVVAIRGTMSFGDAITDLMVVPESLKVPGEMWGFDGSQDYAHSGILRVAMRIRQDIERQQILHKLFPNQVRDGRSATSFEGAASSKYDLVTEEDRETFTAILGLKRHANVYEDTGMFLSTAFVGAHEMLALDSSYELVVTGHSLGACTASILTLLLRPQFPAAKCVAFAPAGAVFTRELAERSNEWCDSLFIDKDIVARLSWHEVKRLRVQMTDLLSRAKTSKSAIFLALGRGARLSDLVHDPKDEYPDKNSEIRTNLRAKIARLEQSTSLLDTVVLYMPGRPVHFVRTHNVSTKRQRGNQVHAFEEDDVDLEAFGGSSKGIRHCCTSGGLCGLLPNHVFMYTPFLVRDRTQVKDAQISPRLLADHMPDLLERILIKAREQMDAYGTNLAVLPSSN